MKKILLGLIKFYQKTFSPDHGKLKEAFPFGFCRYEPTCSEYSYQSIEKYGSLKGTALGFWRIVRCNPFSRGGKDPLPQNGTDRIKKQTLFGATAIIIYILIIISLAFFLKEMLI